MNISEYHENVHDEISKHLNHDVPNGIYAGSAVSSIVLGKLWRRQIPVIDLFERYLDYPYQTVDESSCVVRFTRPFKDEPSLHVNGYTTMSSSIDGSVITRRYFRMDALLSEEKRAMNLLRGLGLNALQVAYCHNGNGSGELYATAEFLEFVIFRQLRVTCPVDGRTFLELAKFQDLFDAYVAWDEEALLMSGFRQGSGCYDNACDDELVVDDKLLMEKYYNRLSNHCHVDELDQLVLPGFEDELKARWAIEFNHCKESDIQAQIRTACLYSRYSLTSYTYTYVFNILFRKSTRETHKKRFWMALEDPVAAKYVMDNTEYIQSDFSSKHLQELSMFEARHPLAVKLLTGVTPDFMSIAKGIRLLKSLGKVHGNPDFVIGLLEQAQSYGIQLREVTEQSINELIATYSSIGDSKLIDAADLSQFKHKDAITELTSSDALRWEGVRCSNCIGGYAGTVKNAAGKVRIFHVHTEDDNQHGTVAIYFNPTRTHMVEYELFGPKNTKPTKKHIKITNALALYLRDTIWKSESKMEEQTIDFDTEQ